MIGPDRKIKLVLVSPMRRRKPDEMLQVIDSLQLTAERKLATPSTGSRARTS